MTTNSLPMILQLDKTGSPIKWIDCEKAAYYYCKSQVLWEQGTNTITVHGGINVATNSQSKFVMNAIIAVDGRVTQKTKQPSISNRLLFKRDGMRCAYCNNVYTHSHLTRDHIHPRVKGGKNTWTNIVTACRPCNSYKGHTLLSVLKWPLNYEPYEPSRAEILFLKNSNMLNDQCELLLSLIPSSSRVHQLYNNPKDI